LNISSMTAAKGSAFPGKERVLPLSWSGPASAPQSDDRELFNKTANSVAPLMRAIGSWDPAALPDGHSRTEKAELLFCTRKAVPDPNGHSASPRGYTGVAKNARNHSARGLALYRDNSPMRVEYSATGSHEAQTKACQT